MTELTLIEMGKGEIGAFSFPEFKDCECFKELDIGKPIKREFFAEGFKSPGVQLKGKSAVVKSNELGYLGQRIFMDNGKIFTREAHLKFDASGHDKSEVHFNIDLITRLKEPAKMHETHNEMADKRVHRQSLDGIPHYYLMALSDQSAEKQPHSIQRQWGFEFREDTEYREKQDEWRSGKLTEEESRKFKEDVFNPYAEKLQQRLNKNAPLNPKFMTKNNKT